MMIRTAFVLLFIAVAGCVHPSFENTHQIQFADSKTPRQESQVASPVADDSNSFDPTAHVKVVDEREAAVIADYIGLTYIDATELARNQNRRIATPYVDGEAQSMTADYCFGRIHLTINNGIVTGAELPEGVDVGFTGR